MNPQEQKIGRPRIIMFFHGIFILLASWESMGVLSLIFLLARGNPSFSSLVLVEQLVLAVVFWITVYAFAKRKSFGRWLGVIGFVMMFLGQIYGIVWLFLYSTVSERAMFFILALAFAIAVLNLIGATVLTLSLKVRAFFQLN